MSISLFSTRSIYLRSLRALRLYALLSFFFLLTSSLLYFSRFSSTPLFRASILSLPLFVVLFFLNFLTLVRDLTQV